MYSVAGIAYLAHESCFKTPAILTAAPEVQEAFSPGSRLLDEACVNRVPRERACWVRAGSVLTHLYAFLFALVSFIFF